MTYASLWSFSYFTFTLNQLLTPDTREYVYTKIWALHRFSFLKQVCRLWNLPLCYHCTPACTKLSHVSNKTLYLFSIREGTCTTLVGWPCSAMEGGGGFTEKMQKKTLKVNHGWPWFGKAFLNHSQPWLTMVWQSFSKPWSTIGLWNGTSVNHGWPWLAKALSTMVNHGWQKHCQPWSTMVGKSIVNHG